jgi:membrane complex biogenesis BtpA family protein
VDSWLNEVFEVDRPIIGMCHLPALPGDPGFDEVAGVEAIVEHARGEIRALIDGGIDGILISNEFSLPYLTRTEPITAVTMARVIGQVHDLLTVPFGVDVLWDPMATIDLAAATGAAFAREVMTGAYAGDLGLWDTEVGRTARHRRRVSAGTTRLLFNVVPEGAEHLAARDLERLTRSTVFNAAPDALCVSGLTAGSPTDLSQLATVKRAAGRTPVLVNTGVTPDTVADALAIADGAVVGTSLKEDGVFRGRIDVERVRRLMAAVAAVRGERAMSVTGGGA